MIPWNPQITFSLRNATIPNFSDALFVIQRSLKSLTYIIIIKCIYYTCIREWFCILQTATTVKTITVGENCAVVNRLINRIGVPLCLNYNETLAKADS